MCGIFGYVGDATDGAVRVHEGLKRLEYRGYDSWGIAVGNDGHVHAARAVGKLDSPPGYLPPAQVALGHTRWATTGPVTRENAHPHTDCTGRIALVHNGIIENYVALRHELEGRGHHFHSDTDTEVATHLLEEQLKGPESEKLAEALRRVMLRLDGLNALAALDVASGELAAVKNGSPLVVGVGDGEQYLASDMASVLPHTDRLIHVDDHQVIVLEQTGVRGFNATTGDEIQLDIEQVEWRPEDAELGDYHHFLEKEIWEQPDLLRRIARDGEAQATVLSEAIRKAEKVYLVACGTAFHAALIGRHMLLAEGLPATAVHAHEFNTVERTLGAGDLVIAFSQSGETIDVIDAMRTARRRGATLAALVNVPGSSLSREVDMTIMLGAGPEKSVLSTKTFTAKLAYLALTRAALRANVQDGRDELLAAADILDAQREESVQARIKDIAHHIVDRQSMFVLGRSISYPLALESALKIKEVTYIHAEGLPSGELKHGTIALIDPGTPVIVLAPEGPDRAHALTAAGEVKARGAFVIGVGGENADEFDVHIPLEPHHPGQDSYSYALSAYVPIQLLAYELALLRGADPDKPRNLAKSVTVR